MPKRITPVLTLLVDNEFGVLVRVSSQIRREGWNIKSLAVAETTNPLVSRITLTVECLERTLEAVLHKLQKLQCVKSVSSYDPTLHSCYEMALMRVDECDVETILPIAKQFGLVEMEREDAARMFTITAEPETLSSCIEAIKAICPIEVARTGAVTLEKRPQQGVAYE